MGKLFRVLACAALLAACNKASDTPPAPAPAPANGSGSSGSAAVAVAKPAGTGWYRAVVGEKQGTAIPFFLQIPESGDEAYTATGPDRVKIKLVSRPPKLVAAFEILHTQIEATANDKGVLDGTWASTSKSWGTASLSFHAEPIASPDPELRLPSSGGGPDPTGVWKVTLTKPTELGKLVIKRGAGPHEVTGTLEFQTGNIAFLAGNMDGKKMRMSAFDGSSPFLLIGDFDDKAKTFTGSWVAGQALDWKETLKGEKVDDFKLDLQTKLATKRPKLNVPQLLKPPYKGKPVIVELGGSWCPACGNATVKLKELLAKYGPDGLQVITLAYEFTDDSAYNKAQAEFFKNKFKATWDIVPIDGGLEKYTEILPPEIEAIDASGFPLTLWIAPDGGIEGFHNGFPAEKWGALHQETLDYYDKMTAKIVAELKAEKK
jgi:thiol-disulfide isomerase/thioredoxin